MHQPDGQPRALPIADNDRGNRWSGNSARPAARIVASEEWPRKEKGELTMNTVTTQDGARIYYKDWGSGQPVVFSHGWPLSSEAWGTQMLFLAQNGYRVIAHDRRGHG